MTDPLGHVTPGMPFSPQAATWNKFTDAARAYEASRTIFSPGSVVGGAADGIVEGVLTSDVTAATNPLTGATTFTIQLLSPDDTDTHDPQHLVQASTDTAGVNTTNQSATTGTRAFCVYMHGRLQYLFGDCP